MMIINKGLFKKKTFDLVLFLVLFYGLLYFVINAASTLDYNWQFEQTLPFFYVIDEGEIFGGVFYDGLLTSLEITFFSFLIAVFFGLIVMLMSQSRSIVARGLSLIYVELIRNTPLLVQIYLIYFILGPTLDWDRMTCGIIALAIFEASYIAEILRSGVQSIVKGQWEAAFSLGFSKYLTYTYIILPQALRLILPPMTNVFINLIKHSSIVSVIAVSDLTTEARNAISDTFLSFEIWFAVAAVYLIVTITVAFIMSFVEHLVKIKE